MTMRLVFVSHAPTSFTRRAAFPQDVPVEPIHSRGQLGRLTGAYAGPELRCVQTGQSFGLEPTVDAALRDWDYGSWAGRTLDEIEPTELKAWLTDPDSAPHGGDSLSAVLKRVGEWLGSVAFPAGRTAVFTHPAVIRAAIVHALGAPAAAFWRVDIAPLSTTRLSGSPGRWTLTGLSPSGGRWSR